MDATRPYVFRYRGARKPPRPNVYKYRSESERGREYLLYELRGVYLCECRGAKRSKSGLCKHIKHRIEKDGYDWRNATVTNVGTAVMTRPNNPVALANLPSDIKPIPVMARPSLPSEAEFRMMTLIASAAVDGGASMLPKGIENPKQALAVMLAGHELGFTPFASLRQVYPVNGKMQLMTQGLISLVLGRDPTAVFVFHRYDHEGADVELIRGGVSRVRIAFEESDRARAHLGERKKRDPSRTLTNRKDNSTYHPYFDPPQYEIDPESPWGKFSRDMFCYRAVSRCVNLAAPDCVNLGMGVPVTDGLRWTELEARADYMPESAMHRALATGELDVKQIAQAGGLDPEGDEASPIGAGAATVVDPRPAAQNARAAQTTATKGRAASEARPKAPAASANDAVGKSMQRTKDEFPTDWPRNWRTLSNRFNWGDNGLAYKQLNAADAAECLRMLRGMRGEAEPEEIGMTTPAAGSSEQSAGYETADKAESQDAQPEAEAPEGGAEADAGDEPEDADEAVPEGDKGA